MDNLQVPWEQLRDFYEKFLFGDLVLKRKKPPTLQVIMFAERRCWRDIALLIYNGVPLRTALQDIRNDSLWWTNGFDSTNKSRTKGKGKAKDRNTIKRKPKGRGESYNSNPFWMRYPSNTFTKFQSGKAKGKSKSEKAKKGKGKHLR